MIPQIGGVICSTNYDTYVRKLRYCHYCDEKLTEYKFKLIAEVIKILFLVKSYNLELWSILARKFIVLTKVFMKRNKKFATNMCFVELILLAKKKAINPNKVTNEHKKILSLFYLDYGNLCSRELAENDWVLELVIIYDDVRREAWLGNGSAALGAILTRTYAKMPKCLLRCKIGIDHYMTPHRSLGHHCGNTSRMKSQKVRNFQLFCMQHLWLLKWVTYKWV